MNEFFENFATVVVALGHSPLVIFLAWLALAVAVSSLIAVACRSPRG